MQSLIPELWGADKWYIMRQPLSYFGTRPSPEVRRFGRGRLLNGLKSFQLYTPFEVLHLLHWAADMQPVIFLQSGQTEVQCSQYCIHAAGRKQAV